MTRFWYEIIVGLFCKHSRERLLAPAGQCEEDPGRQIPGRVDRRAHVEGEGHGEAGDEETDTERQHPG